MLGARVGDELVDLFPGSRAIERAWERFQAEPELNFAGPRALAGAQLALAAGS